MIFFSAHGVPLTYVEDAGDPYKDQMDDCIYLIMQELKARGSYNDHTLAYQVGYNLISWGLPYSIVIAILAAVYFTWSFTFLFPIIRFCQLMCFIVAEILQYDLSFLWFFTWPESSWTCAMAEALHRWSSCWAWSERCQKSSSCTSKVCNLQLPFWCS